MEKEVSINIEPEHVEVANQYLLSGSIAETSAALGIPTERAVTIINKKEVQRYIDNVYLDTGFRNRFRLAEAMDTVIERKLEEMEETEMASKKDIADLLNMAHKMRMDEIREMSNRDKVEAPVNQTNINLPFGSTNYGKLMDKLINRNKPLDGISNQIDDA